MPTATVPKGLVLNDESARARWKTWSTRFPGPYRVVTFSDYGQDLLQEDLVFWDGQALQTFPEQYNVAVQNATVSAFLSQLHTLMGKIKHPFPPSEYGGSPVTSRSRPEAVKALARRESGLHEGFLRLLEREMLQEKGSRARHALRQVPLAVMAFDADAYAAVPRHSACDPEPAIQHAAVDQKRSGRCWIFAGLNLLRYNAASELMDRPKDFVLSGAFVMFHDKLEKAALFLYAMIELRDRVVDDEDVRFLLTHPVSDGGQFSMLVDLLEKYGVVPDSTMPDSLHASDTQELNCLLNNALRFFAAKVRSAKRQDLDDILQDALRLVYNLLVGCLGSPPKSFRLQPGRRLMTPVAYFQQISKGLALADEIALVNIPQYDRPFMRTFVIDRLGSMRNGRPVRYLNVSVEIMKAAVVRTLDLGRRCWFGCDMQQCSDRKHGVLDPRVFDWSLVLGGDVLLPKATRFMFKQGQVTHAMVFCCYHRNDKDEVETFRVENTWGSSIHDGYLDMHTSWFDEYVYECVVPRQVLAPHLLQVWDSDDPIHLPPWDPLGALLT